METVENRGGTPDQRDAETVRLLQQRRPEGLRLLLESYAGKVRWFLRREFGKSFRDMEVEEVINLAAHRAWRRADTFDESRGTLRAWFYVIARNSAVEILRREERRQRPKSVEDWDRATLRVVKPDPEARSGVSDTFLEDLRACIDKLTPTQMSIIKADLRSGDLADANELAKSLKTTRNSIYASRSIARKTLRRELIKLGHSLGDPAPTES